VASTAASGDDRSLPGRDQVEALALQPHHLGPGRHRHDRVLAPRAVPLLSLAVAAASGPVVWRVAQRRQVPARGVADQNDVSSPAAITAVRPASRHMSLAAEAHRAVATPASLDVDLGAVAEHGANMAAGWGL
jgi:hypothetical protein